MGDFVGKAVGWVRDGGALVVPAALLAFLVFAMTGPVWLVALLAGIPAEVVAGCWLVLFAGCVGYLNGKD